MLLYFAKYGPDSLAFCFANCRVQIRLANITEFSRGLFFHLDYWTVVICGNNVARNS